MGSSHGGNLGRTKRWAKAMNLTAWMCNFIILGRLQVGSKDSGSRPGNLGQGI